ncbi:MAG: response regulator [Bdellovibrionales bacterium]|nr:response regulator [Bdellovibrionales bacterium]
MKIDNYIQQLVRTYKANISKRSNYRFYVFATLGFTLAFSISYTFTYHQNNVIHEQKRLSQLSYLFADNLELFRTVALNASQINLSTNSFREFLDTRRKINNKLNHIIENNAEINFLLNQERSPSIKRIFIAYKSLEIEPMLNEFLVNAEEATEITPNFIRNYQKKVNSIIYNSMSELGPLYKSLIRINRSESDRILERGKYLSLLIFLLCVTEILIIWFMVFKPLITTLKDQQHDIMKALMDAESANRAKTDFIANVSHEIRTPMTAILGYTELLTKTSPSKEEIGKSLNIINKNASHLLGLIDEILDVSKIESGNYSLNTESFNLQQFLNEIFSLMNVKAREKNVNLIFKSTTSIPETIETDRIKLKQILFNLIGNAIKFTGEGQVEVRMGISPQGILSFNIKDTGIGMSPETQKKIFRPFSQADSSLNRKYGGTGLGLALSKKIAKVLGGDVELVSSELNRGSEFKFFILPETISSTRFDSLSTNIADASKPSVSNGASALSGVRILIVDDAIENGQLFEIYLRNAGANVDYAVSGMEAIKLAQEKPYDLVLLDLQMPIKNGFETFNELKELDFYGPIVALTAHAMKEEQERSIQHGFTDHIVKPISSKDLIERLNIILETVG